MAFDNELSSSSVDKQKSRALKVTCIVRFLHTTWVEPGLVRGSVFGDKKYSDALWEVVKERDIQVNLRSNLIEVKPESKEAIFQNFSIEKNYFLQLILLVCPNFEKWLLWNQV